MSGPLEPEDLKKIDREFKQYTSKSRVADPCQKCGYVGYTFSEMNDKGAEIVRCNNCSQMTVIKNGKHIQDDKLGRANGNNDCIIFIPPEKRAELLKELKRHD